MHDQTAIDLAGSLATILIVDDDATNVELLRGILASTGHRLLVACNGREALELLPQHAPDLLLLDLLMPEIDGFEVCRRIKTSPQWQGIPIIIVTALDEVEDYTRAIDCGADDFMTKPFNAAVLLARVRGYLRSKRAVDALRSSEERFSKAFHASPDAICITRFEDGAYIDVNDNFLRLSGYRRDEIIGRSTQQLDWWLDPGDHARAMQMLRNSGSAKDVATRFRTASGEVREALASFERIRLGNMSCVLGIIRDVTEQKQLEARMRQTQKMEALGTLAGGIAHDFNNMLQIMLGYAGLALEQMPVDHEVHDFLQQVCLAGNRAAEMVKHILAFSRRNEQDRKPVELYPLVKETLQLLRASLPTTIDIRQHIDSTAGSILADPTQIHQVLMNLCTNAEHAMRETGGILEVRLQAIEVEPAFAALHPELHTGPYVQLTVRDTGHGMRPEILERIFEPFFTTKARGEGTGMGLAVVHGIVASHGGIITAQSLPNHGSTFDIYFPRIETPVSRDTHQEEALRRGQERILFVDDETALAYLGRDMLTYLGYSVVPCTSGIEALETFRSAPQQFDLVVTDQTMPRMTGEHLSRELRRLRPDIPIILCTGFSHVINEAKAQDLGLQAYLMKPLKLRDLGSIIRDVLDHKAGEVTTP